MPKKSKLEKLIRTNIIGIITTKSASYRMTKLAGFKIILSIIILLFAQSVQSQNCSTLSPAFTYTLSNSGCSSPDTISFSNTSSGSGLSGATFYWNVNHTAFDTTTASTSPNSISKTSGTYTITLISITAASCIDSVSKTITIRNAISPSFTNVSDTICLGSAMLFTNSTSGSTTGNTYKWKVGNSTFSSHSDTASYVFSTSGNHVITLSIKKGNCTYTTSKNITVASGRQPIRFYNNLGIALQTVTWTRCLTLVTDPDSINLTFASPDTLLNYTFDFGDGNSIQGDTLLPFPNGLVSHTYQSTGVYDLIVTTNDLNTCLRTFYGKVINLRYPVVGIGGPDNGHSNGCIPFVSSFKNNSSHVSDCTQFTWNFGDGSTETYNYTNANDTIYHNYVVTNCNIYVTLSATNSCGSTQTTWGPINAYTSDIAEISANNNVFCHPNTTVTLQNLTQYNCYSGTKFFYWNFGDGTNTGWSSIGIGQSHTYTTPGKYTITFTDSNLCGIDTATEEIIVYGPIQAGFMYSPSQLGCIDYMVTFTDTSVGDSLTYVWNFGDATTSTLQNPIHTYTDTGIYIVSLEVTGLCGSSTVYDTIYVYKKPVAEIATISNGCQPFTVSYVNNTSDYSPFVSYVWDLGNSSSSTNKNPNSQTFASAGTYTVVLIANDTCGSDTAQTTFTIYKNPIANFIADTVCNGNLSSFSNLSSLDTASGSIVSHNWNFGDNSSSTQENPQHTYATAGSYQVQLVVISSFGCSDTTIKTVVVKENPSITLSVNPNNYACNLASLNFSSTASNSSSSIDSFIWNFGDGNSSFSQNTSHVYNTYGSYSVTLTVVSGNTCNAILNQQVNIYLPPVANYSVDTVCEGNFTNFTNTSTTSNAGNISSYQWDFDSDGTFDNSLENPSFKYASSGSYTAKLHITSQYGCSDSISKTVYVYGPIQAAFSYSPSNLGCKSYQVSFTDASVGDSISYFWNFGDGTNSTSKSPSHTFADTGIFITSLTVTGVCGYSTVYETIYVYKAPVASFTQIQNGCNPFAVNYTNTSSELSPYASYYWNLGNGSSSSQLNPSAATFSTPGTYEVILVVSDTCGIDSFKQSFTVYKNPVAAFSFDSVCQGNQTTFQDLSSIDVGNGTISSYLWIFGDGDSSTAQNPAHTYASAGNYQVQLSILSSFGCSASITKTVLVQENPSVSFSMSPSSQLCNFTPIQFIGSAQNSTSLTDSFVWNYGDGANGTGSSSTHSYTNYGNYNVTLTAVSDNACSNSLSKQVEILVPPQASFSASPVCQGTETQFTDLSVTNNNEAISGCAWDFDLNGVADDTNRNSSYTFNTSGNFDVQLVITTEYGCKDTVINNVTVYANPTVAFTLSSQNNCENSTISLANNCSNADSFIWNYGDQSSLYLTKSSNAVTHAYSNDGTYSIKLTAYNNDGCYGSDSSTINIYPNPNADFSSPDYSSCVPFSISFTNNSQDADSFEWFVDGILKSTSSSLSNQIFSTPNDTIEVIIIAKNQFGCTADTLKKTYFTLNNPVPSFSVNSNQGCGPLSVSFSNNSANSLNYFWEFGDGNSSSSTNPTHTFQASAYNDTLYLVKLFAYSSSNCIDSITDTIHVYASPIAGFTLDKENGCGPLNVSFTNSSVENQNTSVANSTLNYSWNFGNGLTSTTKDTSVQFVSSLTQDSIYTILLSATNAKGCNNQIAKNVRVYPKPDVKFYMTSNSGCAPLNISFVNNSTPNDTGTINDMSFSWDLGNGQNSTAVNVNTSYQASLTKDSFYTVSLSAMSEHACLDVLTKTVQVYPNPVSSFSINKLNGCSPLNATFTNTSIPNDTGSINIMNFFWSFGNGMSSNSVNANINYFKSNYQDTSYSIQLIAFNEHNCIDTSYQSITVYPNPAIQFSSSITNGCGPLSVSFTNLSSPKDTGSIDIMNFLWDFNNGSTSSLKNSSSSFIASQSKDTMYQVKLVGFSEHGCSDSTISNIRVYPDPKVSFTTNQLNGCGPLSVSFTNTSDPGDTTTIDDMTFFWDFGNGTTSSTKNNTVSFQKSVTQDTVYQVVLTAYSEHGCVGFDTAYITVYPDPIALFAASTVNGCSPLQVSFSNQSNPNNGGSIGIMNFEWTFGTGDSSVAQDPAYTFINTQNTKQQFNVMLHAYSEHGCVANYSNQISVSPSPEVSYYISDSVACNDLKVFFVNTTDPHDQEGINKMSFAWDFDNGITSSTKDTNVTFAHLASGTIVYDVVLSAINAFGCQNSYQNEITIFTDPVADFTFNNPKDCGNNVVFTNSSTPNDNQNLASMSFSWNFGNQKVSTKINDTISFIQSHVQDTNFLITLVAVNTLGCSDTTSKNVLVHTKPQVSFAMSTNETCSGVNVNFLNKSKNISKSLWMFGDSHTDTMQHPSHAYNNNSPNAYLYNVKLYGESIHGCPGDTFTQNILVHPTQSAGIITSIDSGCSPLSVNFYNNSHNSSLFHWTVDNSLISTNTNLNYTFPGSTLQDSVYTVRLIAQNGIGCIDTAVHTVKVYRRTVASFTMQSNHGCSPTQVSFQNQTTGATDYFWNLGNGQTSTSENPSTTFTNHLFQDLDYTVTLFAISSRNCFDTTSRRVTVNPIPVASFSADKLQGCDPVVVNFTNQSIISDSFQWNFGDGVTSSLLNPAHAFITGVNDTIYKVKLTVFSEHGCKHSFTKEIKVYASPKAKVNFAIEGCAPVTAKFKDESENAVFWNWQFGDGHTSSERNPEHIYFSGGVYSVKLRVSNYLGCSDTLTLNKTVIVHDVPVANFIADKYYSEYPELTFNFTSTSPSGLLHNWAFGNDRVIKTTNTVQYSFKDTGVYIVTLAVSTPYCSDTTWKQIIIDPPYPIAGFTFDAKEGCMPMTVSFTDTSTMTSGWLWYFGDGTTSNDQHPVHTYTEPGKFSVTLITTNTRGSDAEYKMNIIDVHPKPTVYFEASPETAYLPNAKVDLVNLTVNGVEYAWFIDGQFYDSLENTSKIFYEAGTYDVMLFAKSKNGCIDSLIIEDAILVDTMSQVYMPNAFTPNGDGLNDEFKPLGYGYSDLDYTLQIFNRWGEKIFESNDFNEGWNGSFRNQLCSQGIYVYRLAVKLASNETKYMEGKLTLIR